MKKTTRKIGDVGEEIASTFLKQKGLKIMARNVYFKTGELDIVAKNIETHRVHVIEVKTVNGNTSGPRVSSIENMTHKKIQRIQVTAQLFANQKRITDWQIDAIFISIDSNKQKNYIQHVGNFC